MTKTIKCKVRCEYWNRPESFEIVVDDDATEEEIEQEMREVASDIVKIDFWREDE